MRITRPRLGLLEWGILAAAVVLIGAEAAAIVAGLGPVFAVIVLGYFLVLGAIYWVYRRERVTTAHQASLVRARVEAKPTSGADTTFRKQIDIFRDLDDEQVDRVQSLTPTPSE